MPTSPGTLQEPGQKIIDVDTAAQMLQLVLPQVRAGRCASGWQRVNVTIACAARAAQATQALLSASRFFLSAHGLPSALLAPASPALASHSKPAAALPCPAPRCCRPGLWTTSAPSSPRARRTIARSTRTSGSSKHTWGWPAAGNWACLWGISLGMESPACCSRTCLLITPTHPSQCCPAPPLAHPHCVYGTHAPLNNLPSPLPLFHSQLPQI